MNGAITTVIEQALLPTARLFDMRVATEREDANYAEVRFVNATTGLAVAIDWGEFRPFVQLAKLHNGSFPPPSLLENIPAASARQAFDADDLISLRAEGPTPVGKMLAARDLVAARRLLDEYATALQKYCADVLEGRFEVFAKLNEVVNDRARHFLGER